MSFTYRGIGDKNHRSILVFLPLVSSSPAIYLPREQRVVVAVLGMYSPFSTSGYKKNFIFSHVRRSTVLPSSHFLSEPLWEMKGDDGSLTL